MIKNPEQEISISREALGEKSLHTGAEKSMKYHSKSLKINSTKSIIGHSSGGAGAMEAIACVKSIESQEIHGTINLIDKDEDCDLDYTPNKSYKMALNHTLSNSFGFGGQNSCLIISKFENR